MVLKISTFNVTSERKPVMDLSEYGALTIHCSEVDETEGYLRLRVFDGVERSPELLQSAKVYKVPVRNETTIYSITDETYEICAIYKQEGNGDRKLEVIFLYVLDWEKATALQPVSTSSHSEFYFSRPGLTVAIALN